MSNRQAKQLRARRRRSALWIVIATAFFITTVDGNAQKPLARTTNAAPADAKRPTVNRTVPRVSAPPLLPVFSEAPTERELRAARVFGEPLLPLAAPTAAENQALAAAVTQYANAANPFEIQPFTAFLNQQPSSVWRASLQANLGGLHRASGYYTRALRAWDEAWRLSKDARSIQGRAVADFTAGQALDMLASMGQVGGLDRWLERTKDHAMSGPAATKAERAREVRALIAKHPERVIPSGPKAIEILIGWESKRTKPPLVPVLSEYTATPAGTSLLELRTLASKAGLSMKMVRREAGARLVTPAVVHLGFDHFTAVLEEKNGMFRLRDPALGGEVWMPRAALEEEMSGAALIATGADAPGWHELTDADAAAIVGHSCPPGLPDPDECPCKDSEPGMPTYSLHRVQASVLLADAPLEYTPARGPSVHAQLRYNHREENQPQTFTFANLGARWTLNWVSYVEEQPFTWYEGNAYAFPAHVAVHVPQGGVERFVPNGDGTYPRHFKSAAVLVHVSDNPLIYERRHTDGSTEVYAVPGGGVTGSRRVFLSSMVDPHGQALTFTWDAQLRPVALTDALGQVTTLQYDDTDPLKITSVTDPFGRIARLTYDGDGHLASVTDVINLRSTFTYGDADFIAAMQTPYGLTAFRTPTISGENARAVEAVDPLGAVERLEFWWTGAPVPATVPTDQVPPGFETRNSQLDTITSLHWGKGRNTSNVQEAYVWRWLIHSMDYFWDPGWSVGVPHSIQPVGEARIWYDYTGSTARPSKTARKLPDGSVYEVDATYNTQDNVTWRKDPVGRATTYTYAANGIDLLEVRNTTAGRNDLLATSADYTAGHLPQTLTDAAGQVTRTTYDDAGQVLTVTNAKQEQTTYTYDANGYLQTVTGPVPGATVSYTYDGYGRLRSATPAGEALVTTEYDALNRPTRTTYADGTYEETTYERLDTATRRDRAGRVTRLTHDALRRVVATRDPAGRTVQQQWCPCGALDALVDANAHATRWERDAAARVLREVRADGVTATGYTYDALGRLVTVTDPKQQVTTYTYNLDGSVGSVAYTNAQVATPGVSWTYDPAYARVTSMMDGTGTTAYTYHPAGALGAGQVATVDGPLTNDVISYTYDALGRVVTRAIDNVPLTYTYDALGRVQQEVNVLGTFAYTYDGVSGRLATVAYPNNQTSAYTYSPAAADHRLQQILHRYPNGNVLSQFDYTYDAAGNIVTWRQQADTTAVMWEYGYDNADQLTRAVKRATDPPGTILQRFGDGYDQAGNRLYEQTDDSVTAWTYDRLNRLVTQQAGGTLRVAGTVNEPATVRVNGQPATVDANGAFSGGVPVASGTTRFTIAATDASGNATTASYDVDQTGASKTFTFDANGNLASDGTRTLEWDARNQLAAINVRTHRSEFTYDGLRRRVRIVEKDDGVIQSDTKVIWCDSDICEERAADGTTITRRAFGQGEQVSGISRYFAADHLGSVTEVADATSALLARYAFDPWGGRTLTAGTDVTNVGYTGHRWQSNGSGWLTLYRFLDPTIGRWATEDPAGLQETPNLHMYVGNNPTNSIDLFGDEQALPLPRPGPGPAIPFIPPGLLPEWLQDMLDGLDGNEVTYDRNVTESPYPEDKPKPCDDWKQRWGCLAKGHLTPTTKHPNKNQRGFIVFALGYGQTRPEAEDAARRNVQHAVPPHWTKGWWYVRHVNEIRVVKCWRQ